ncbi:MAG: alanine dehydrogenase [Deltaproteobacteria bacterium]|nr:alanine dehydrogenase [Deltaproteobacteria bacterium]
MIIGVPTEIKVREYRVGMIPAGVRMLTARGHHVLVQAGAGLGSGISDEEYQRAGAEILRTREEVWKRAEMIVKVKEPLPDEYPLMREGQIVYTYLHLAAAQELGHEMLKRKVEGVAYETIETDDGKLPLLQPMSSVAGRMSVQVGAACLEKAHGGKGILLGGVPGVRRGRVAILGGGVVGASAARIAVGFGASVTVLDINPSVLAYLDDIYQGQIHTLYSDPHTIEETVRAADLVVGAVLVAGARAPRLVTEQMVATMEPGSVIVDVAVDQGGCVETCHPTTHDNPTYLVHGVIHYAVANMPGAVARTSTYALCNATIGYARQLADHGLVRAAQADRMLTRGINTFRGHCPHKAVAEALQVEHVPFERLL